MSNPISGSDPSQITLKLETFKKEKSEKFSSIQKQLQNLQGSSAQKSSKEFKARFKEFSSLQKEIIVAEEEMEQAIKDLQDLQEQKRKVNTTTQTLARSMAKAGLAHQKFPAINT